MIERQALDAYLSEYLEVPRFRDYCPNGLQVEGRAAISRIVTGVTASMALIEAARDAGADALIVHHGYFWKGEDARVIGARRRRIAALLAADLNLYAYHLPLDAHAEVGNNARLGAMLGLAADGRFGEQDLIHHGRLEPEAALERFAQRVATVLDRVPLVIGDPGRPLRRVAWCTGGAQGWFEEAVRAGVDAYLTGEASEHNTHLALESGVAFIAAGHHATERYGVQALGDHLAARFGLEHRFIDVPNPV